MALYLWFDTGPETFKQYVSMGFPAFPDFHSTIEDLIAEGDSVVVRLTNLMTHKGNYMGIPPTGKQVIVTEIAITRFATSLVLATSVIRFIPTCTH